MELRKDLKLLIFDFDGTLHHMAMDWPKARQILGIAGSQELLGDAVERLKKSGRSEPLQKLTDLEAEALRQNRLAPEVKKTMQKLQKGYKIAVLSRNSSQVIADFLSANGLKADLIIGREDVAKLKPDPEGLQKILNHFKAGPNEALMIGDTYHDVLAAHAAGLKCLIIGGEYKSESNLSPDYRARRFSDMERLL